MTSTKAFALLAAALVLAACGSSTDGAAPASSAPTGAGTMSPAAAPAPTPSASTATPSPSASAGAAALQAKEAVVEGVPAVPVKVLIVDDSRAFRLILTRVLRQAGYDAVVTEAATGEEGLAQLDGQQFDLILSDWNMPGMGGLETLSLLRSRAVRLPAFLITSHPGPAVRQRAVRMKVPIIEKPLLDDILVRSIRSALGQVPTP